MASRSCRIATNAAFALLILAGLVNPAKAGSLFLDPILEDIDKAPNDMVKDRIIQIGDTISVAIFYDRFNDPQGSIGVRKLRYTVRHDPDELEFLGGRAFTDITEAPAGCSKLMNPCTITHTFGNPIFDGNAGNGNLNKEPIQVMSMTFNLKHVQPWPGDGLPDFSLTDPFEIDQLLTANKIEPTSFEVQGANPVPGAPGPAPLLGVVTFANKVRRLRSLARKMDNARMRKVS
jgi:hypothetical protein